MTLKRITSERGVLLAARRVARLNDEILAAGRFDGTLPGYLAQESRLADLTAERDALLASVREYDDAHNADRRGEWFMSASGRRFWPLDPRPADVHPGDIAHGLSMLCRFCGHVRSFYSVAQHSVLVSRVVHPRAALAGLLHDASEAYLGDLIRPIKRHLPGYAAFEDAVMAAVCVRFGLDPGDEDLWREVKRGDNVLLSTEFRDVARCGARLSPPEEPPAAFGIGRCWGVRRARREFAARFRELYAGD